MNSDLLLLGLFDQAGYETPLGRTIGIPPFHERKNLLRFPAKFAGELFDYKLDWTLRLLDDTIFSVKDGTASGAVTTSRVIFDETTVSFWLGAGRAGNGSLIQCLVTTTGGRLFEEFLEIRVL